jgi:hypothetical protein
LKTQNDRQRCQNDGPYRSVPFSRRVPGPADRPERNPEYGEGKACKSLDRPDAEIANQIVVRESLEKVPDVLDRKLEEHAADGQVACLQPVNCRHRHVHHHGSCDVETKQDVRLEEIAAVNLCQVDLPGGDCVNRGKSVRRVHDVPVSRRHFCHQRQNRVADHADGRHLRHVLALIEPVPLRVIGFLGKDRLYQVTDVPRIHLPVTVQLYCNFVAGRECGVVARHGCSADAPVRAMPQHGDPIGWERRHDEVGRLLRAAIIDDKDVIHVGKHAFDHGDNVSPHAETGNDGGQLHAGSIAGAIPRSRRKTVARSQNSAKLTAYLCS